MVVVVEGEGGGCLGPKNKNKKIVVLPISCLACHPCAGAMLIFFFFFFLTFFPFLLAASSSRPPSLPLPLPLPLPESERATQGQGHALRVRLARGTAGFRGPGSR